jgi:hypothetical protein
MSKGDVYRLRLKSVEKRMKGSNKTDRAVLARKKQALSDMADSEDWLDGKLVTEHKRQDDAR